MHCNSLKQTQTIPSAVINSTCSLDPLMGYPNFPDLKFLLCLSSHRECSIYINPCISQSGKWEKRQGHRKNRNWSKVRQSRYDLANPIRSRYYSFPEQQVFMCATAGQLLNQMVLFIACSQLSFSPTVERPFNFVTKRGASNYFGWSEINCSCSLDTSSEYSFYQV